MARQPALMRFDSASGDYQFLRCGADGFTIVGRGDVQRNGCVLRLTGARVKVEINHCPIAPLDRGPAIVRVTALGPTFVINDRNDNNSDCVCR
ncbi:MAG TPA: hypothetical protein VKE91_11305 [Blastocatellia bacterium]|nr:hypothetical protein [Blastocatellia bacterium]